MILETYGKKPLIRRVLDWLNKKTPEPYNKLISYIGIIVIIGLVIYAYLGFK